MSTYNYDAVWTDVSKLQPYTAPINPNLYPTLAAVLLSIGLFFTAWFFVYEVTTNKKTRELIKELLLALVASIFMGTGTIFLILACGIYI